MQKNRILFITPGVLSPAPRFRVYPYVRYLKNDGFKVDVRPSVPDRDFSPSEIVPAIYRFNKSIARIIGVMLFFLMIVRRICDVSIIWKCDIVYFQREVLNFGYPVFESLAAILNKKIIFDFDDAIYINNVEKIDRIIKMSSHVIVGNKVLCDHALKRTGSVTIIPTSIDTESYIFEERKKSKETVIGFVGSTSTLKSLDLVKTQLTAIKHMFPDVKIVLLSKFKGLNYSFIEGTVYREWTAENEVAEINSFDIGIMPLFDNEWNRGKCGAKLLQYMALKIPAVASPVGVNSEIISHGKNGFLASNGAEWVEYLSALIKNRDLRFLIGANARETIENDYSINRNYEKMLGVINRVRA